MVVGDVRVLEEMYWAESRAEALAIAAEALASGAFSVDCSGGRYPIPLLGDSKIDAALIIAGTLMRMQCTGAWRRLGIVERARVAAPLLRAVYGLYLASRSSGSVREAHYRNALSLLEEAIVESARLGLLAELKSRGRGDARPPSYP